MSVKKLRILAVNQFYAPDHAATAQLLTQLCEDLARAGHEVTVIASRGGYLGSGCLPARELIEGVDVVRPWSTRLGKRTNVHRLCDYLSFWTTAVMRASAERRPDLLLALTTPPMIACGAGVVAAVRRVPLVTWVQDVYPETAVELGVLGERAAITGALHRMNRVVHGLTRTCVVLSDRMADRVERQGMRRDQIVVIPNWADGAAVKPLAHRDNSFRRQHAGLEQFLVVYSGNIGLGHDVATLIEAARQLDRTRPDIRFLFIGDGVRRADAERLAREVQNVRFLPYQPYEILAQSLSAGDLHLVSLREGLDGLLVPSKLFGILAAGRPIAFVGPERSQVAQVIRENRLGWVVHPGNATELARVIATAADDRERTHQLGEDARAVFETRFDRPKAIARWHDALLEAASTAK